MKTIDFEYEIRRATWDDIEAIVECAQVFGRISGHGTSNDLSPDNFRKLLRNYIHAAGHRCIIAESEGNILGYFIIYTHDDYKSSLDGELYQFFVHPDYWCSTVARDLVEMGVQTFDDWGCGVSYVVGSGEINSKQLMLFRNLFAKFGYIETGIVMTRRVQNGITESVGADRGATSSAARSGAQGSRGGAES